MYSNKKKARRFFYIFVFFLIFSFYFGISFLKSYFLFTFSRIGPLSQCVNAYCKVLEFYNNGN